MQASARLHLSMRNWGSTESGGPIRAAIDAIIGPAQTDKQSGPYLVSAGLAWRRRVYREPA